MYTIQVSIIRSFEHLLKIVHTKPLPDLVGRIIHSFIGEVSLMAIRSIAVIGLGEMGTPIAGFLLKAGYDVKGYDPREKQMSALIPLGLKPASSPKNAASGVDMVLLSLPNWDIVQEVVEGKEGILEASHQSQIIIDCTTVPPHKTKMMAEKLAGKGIHWMDVPISGAATQAREGNMVFMAGGEKKVFDQVKPVLDKVGKKTVYVGNHGDAAMLKLTVNLVLFLNQAAAVEGLTLGLRAGLDPAVLYDVLVSGAAGSDLIKTRGKDMLAGNFNPRGALWIGVKDLGLALEAAKTVGVACPMAALYQQMLLGAHHRGWDDHDATVVMRLYEELTGIKR
jgi:3-hydroxyisobutyrate dehydrogenase-like beta-hydroxyacid dehydrogenase